MSPAALRSICGVPITAGPMGLMGPLKETPRFAGRGTFDRTQNGLVPIRVATWEKFVFVTLDEQASGLMTFLGDLQPEIARFSLDNIHFFERKTYTLACNWKVYVDNY